LSIAPKTVSRFFGVMLWKAFGRDAPHLSQMRARAAAHRSPRSLTAP
jgi:hypothetical protein